MLVYISFFILKKIIKWEEKSHGGRTFYGEVNEEVILCWMG
jgi:hypothetical protein